MAMIHVNRSGQSLGIFDEARVREGLATGEFIGTDLGWTEGMPTWRPLSELESFGVAPPPPPVGATAVRRRRTGAHRRSHRRARDNHAGPDRAAGVVDGTHRLAVGESRATGLCQRARRDDRHGDHATGGGILGHATRGRSGRCAALHDHPRRARIDRVVWVRRRLAGHRARRWAEWAIWFGLGASAAFLMFAPVAMVLCIFIGGAIMHLCLMLVGGANRAFETTLRVLVLRRWFGEHLCPRAVLREHVALIATLVLNCIGLARAHQTDTWRRGRRGAAADLRLLRRFRDHRILDRRRSAADLELEHAQLDARLMARGCVPASWITN